VFFFSFFFFHILKPCQKRLGRALHLKSGWKRAFPGLNPSSDLSTLRCNSSRITTNRVWQELQLTHCHKQPRWDRKQRLCSVAIASISTLPAPSWRFHMKINSTRKPCKAQKEKGNIEAIILLESIWSGRT